MSKSRLVDRRSTDGRHPSVPQAGNRPDLTFQENAMMSKNTVCLWYDGDAVDAARFYAETFPNSSVGTLYRAPGDYPDGKQGDVLTVEFTVAGIPCIGLNGGPHFKHNEAFSFQIATDDQAETDRLWNAVVGNGGQARVRGDDDHGQDRHRPHRGGTAGLTRPGRAPRFPVQAGLMFWFTRNRLAGSYLALIDASRA
jgi:2-polyprenyl-6-hydroxyphenyl methylase/3-demethylubiquinone-9 3-methyltransferase